MLETVVNEGLQSLGGALSSLYVAETNLSWVGVFHQPYVRYPLFQHVSHIYDY